MSTYSNDTLSNLASLSKARDSFANPFDDDLPAVSTEDRLSRVNNTPVKKKKQSLDTTAGLKAALDEITSDADKFDFVLDDLSDDDQDLELRQELTGLGRMYARDHSGGGDESELTKAFANQESQLKELYNNINKDTAAIQSEIDEMRMARIGRNYQRMTEMMSTKTTLHSTKLAVIKEMSNIQKTKFDIRAKSEKGKTEGDQSAYTNNIMQSIMGIGHGALLDSVGGRDNSAGSTSEDGGYNTVNSYENSEEYGETIYNQVLGDQDDTDGDIFIKYENVQVEMVLEDYGDRYVSYAVDENGNTLHDYPMPELDENEKFEINERNGTAIDSCQRRYKYINCSN